MSKYTYSDEQFITAIKTSLSIAEVCRKLGMKAAGGNYATVKKENQRFKVRYVSFYR